jgi:hypothetical protein
VCTCLSHFLLLQPLAHYQQMKGDEFAMLKKPPNHKLFLLIKHLSVQSFNVTWILPRTVLLQWPLLSSTSQLEKRYLNSSGLLLNMCKCQTLDQLCAHPSCHTPATSCQSSCHHHAPIIQCINVHVNYNSCLWQMPRSTHTYT